MTVHELCQWVHARAPFDTQEDFDNAGFLVGDPDAEVTGVLFAMDVTDKLLDEARQLSCNLLITHHPMMFHARRRLTTEDREGRLLMRMVQENMHLIAAHTNLDQAPGGINDVLAQTLGLSEIAGEGYIRTGTLPYPMDADTLATHLADCLHTAVRVMGHCPARTITRLGVASGAGGDMWRECGAIDGFVSGEIRHHEALDMNAEGIVAFECGHFATEEPGIFALASALQTDPVALQCNLRVYQSGTGPYAMS